MDNDIKAQWLADLRSGKFPQAHGELIAREATTGDREFCCLGVLVHQAIREGCEGVRYRQGDDAVVEICEENWGEGEVPSMEWSEFTDGELPRLVAEWAGIEVSHGNPKVGGTNLIAMNDDQHANFHEIAEAIETWL